MILITGATGTNGSEAVRALSKAGVPGRAFVRNPEKAKALAGPGVEIAKGDLNDPASIDAALRGVDHALLLVAPDPNQVQLKSNFIEAAKRAGVQHVVNFSAMGADWNSPALFLHMHGESDRQLEASGIPFTTLRPGSFMQNFLASAGMIAGQGTIYAPMGDAAMSFVDVRDITAVIVKALTEPGHAGKTYELTGPEALTHAQVAEKFSAALGRKVTYVDTPPDVFQGNLKGFGMPDWYASGLSELYAGWKAGSAAHVTTAIPDVTGRPATRFDQFVKDNLAAFRG